MIKKIKFLYQKKVLLLYLFTGDIVHVIFWIKENFRIFLKQILPMISSFA